MGRSCKSSRPPSPSPEKRRTRVKDLLLLLLLYNGPSDSRPSLSIPFLVSLGFFFFLFSLLHITSFSRSLSVCVCNDIVHTHTPSQMHRAPHINFYYIPSLPLLLPSFLFIQVVARRYYLTLLQRYGSRRKSTTSASGI